MAGWWACALLLPRPCKLPELEPAWLQQSVFHALSVPTHPRAPPPQVAMHLEYYNRPRLQLRVIRILWMVPIYAVDSWLSLRFKEAR